MYRRGSSKGSISVAAFKSPERLLEEAFRAYYSARPCLEEPPSIQYREFAFQFFGQQSYVRHISFESFDDLLGFLSERAPKHAYYSVALYELPEAGSMEEKGWMGSSLLFDIDLDHVSACEGSTVEVKGGVLLGDECLYEGYRLARKLASMIKRDLSVKKITIYFTGHRGYHVRTECRECLTLGRAERREIALYFAGEGVDPRMIFPDASRRSARRAFPAPSDPGWRGWIAPVLRAKAPEARSLEEAFGRRWQSEVEEAVREAAVPIDVMVTQDPSRLTRLLGSLNGKGALLAVDVTGGARIGYEALSPFRGEVTVRFRAGIDGLRVLGVGLSARRGEEQPLPAGLAMHLIAKGIADPVGGVVRVGKSACGRPV